MSLKRFSCTSTHLGEELFIAHQRQPVSFIAGPGLSPTAHFSLSHTEGLTAELSILSNLSGTDWTTRFFDYWTLKEAYAKARGLGLGLRFKDVAFEEGPDNAIRAHFASSVNDDPSAWLFWRHHLPSKHTISLAVKKDFDGEFRIVRRSVTFDGTSAAEISPRVDLRLGTEKNNGHPEFLG